MFKKTAKRTCAGIMSLAFILGTLGSVPVLGTNAASAVTINEVCPKNTTYASPDGNYYDWIELYNGSGSSVDVGGWGISDKADTPYRFTIPAGTVIPAGGRTIIFCDGTAGETNSAIAPFGLSTSGETITLTDASGNIASQVTFESLAKDTSHGQYPEGSGEYYTLAATPNEANKAPEGSDAVRTPEFSAESGFYDNSFALTLSVPEGTTVYYTLDGSDPTTSSEKYTSAITVKDMTSEPNKYSARTDISAYTDILAPEEGVLKAAVVRAIAVDAQGRASKIITKTYFVGSTNVEKYKNMKVISLVTDPDNLFDYEKGIYVLGKVYEEGGGGMGFGGMGGFNFGGDGQQGGFNFGGDGQQGGFNFGGDGQQGGFDMGNINMGNIAAPVADSDEPETAEDEEKAEETVTTVAAENQEETTTTTEAAEEVKAAEEEDITEEVKLDAVSMEDEYKADIEADEDVQQPQQGGFNFGGQNGENGGWGGFNFGGQNGENGENGGWGGFNFGGQGGEEGGAGGWGGFGGGGMGDFAFMSQANYNQKGPEWERPANIEIFENGQSVVSQDVGIRTKGAASRAWAQKSFNIFARMDYGKGEVEYDLFDGKSTKEKNNKVIDKFDGFTIRNGGNDNMAGFFRDSVNQSLVTDRDMATQATSECILFIDGEFWGIYQLMEKYNTDYFKSHYGVKKNDVAFIKNNSLEDGNDSDLTEWNSLLSEISKADMTSDAAYQQISEKIDLQSVIDYFAAQIYWGNHDWPSNNTGVWRANTVDPENPYADGKWRMVLFDTEYSANLADKVNEVGPTYNSFSQFGGAGGFGGMMGGFGMGGGSLSGAFTNLMKNETFRQQFELSFMDMANYNFDTKKTTEAINYYKGFKQQILDTYERFPSSKHTHNSATFDEDYQLLETFYNTRYANVTSQMKSFMSLTGDLASVSISNDGSKGSVRFNTINLDDSLSTWSGKYFTDYPVTVKATAKEGYSFDHWEVTGADVSNTTSDEITVPVSEGVSIKAVYKEGGAPAQTTVATTKPVQTTTVTPVSVSTNVTINYGDSNCDGEVSLADAVLIMQSIANPSSFGVKGTNTNRITDQGVKNSDVAGNNDGVTNNDALAIQKYCLKLIDKLPE